MVTSHYEAGSLFIQMRYNQAASADEYQWALYLHESDEQGGTLYQAEMTETGLVAYHRQVEDVSQERGELRTIGCVPSEKFKHTDSLIRCLDNGLDHLKEKTSLKWVLIIAANLMEDGIIMAQNIKRFKQEMVTWAARERSSSNPGGDEEFGEAVESSAQGQTKMASKAEAGDSAAGEIQEKHLGKEI